MEIDRLLDSGEVELENGNWRGTRAPGDDLSDLPADIRAEIEAHWAADVGGETRAARYLKALALDHTDGDRRRAVVARNSCSAKPVTGKGNVID